MKTHQEVLDWIAANRGAVAKEYGNHWFFFENRGGKRSYHKIHTFIADTGNEARSAEGFKNRESKRAFPDHTINWLAYSQNLPYYFSVEYGYGYMMSVLIAEYEGKTPIYDDVPVVKYANVFEFYKAIGYDYKKKKFDPNYPYD